MKITTTKATPPRLQKGPVYEFADLISALGFYFETTVHCCGGRIKNVYGHASKLKIKIDIRSLSAVLLRGRNNAHAGKFDAKKIISDDQQKKQFVDLVSEKIRQTVSV